jgi:hypothetical protein
MLPPLLVNSGYAGDSWTPKLCSWESSGFDRCVLYSLIPGAAKWTGWNQKANIKAIRGNTLLHPAKNAARRCDSHKRAGSEVSLYWYRHNNPSDVDDGGGIANMARMGLQIVLAAGKPTDLPLQ